MAIPWIDLSNVKKWLAGSGSGTTGDPYIPAVAIDVSGGAVSVTGSTALTAGEAHALSALVAPTAHGIASRVLARTVMNLVKTPLLIAVGVGRADPIGVGSAAFSTHSPPTHASPALHSPSSMHCTAFGFTGFKGAQDNNTLVGQTLFAGTITNRMPRLHRALYGITG